MQFPCSVLSGGMSITRVTAGSTSRRVIRRRVVLIGRGYASGLVILCLDPWTYSTTYVDTRQFRTTTNPDETVGNDTERYASIA